MACPNNILELTTTIDIDGDFSFVGYLALNVNDIVGDNSHYIQLFSGDTTGKSYDVTNTFYGTIVTDIDVEFSSYITVPINGNDYCIKVFTGSSQGGCSSDIVGDETIEDTTATGYSLIDVNGTRYFVPIYFLSNILTIRTNSIISSEAIGGSDVQFVISNNGIISGEVIGEPDILTNLIISNLGIPTSETIGSPIVDFGFNVISNIGIPSDEAFGQPDVYIHSHYILDMIRSVYINNSNPSTMGRDLSNGMKEKERDIKKITEDNLRLKINNYDVLESQVASTLQSNISKLMLGLMDISEIVITPPTIELSKFIPFYEFTSSSSSSPDDGNMYPGLQYVVDATISGGNIDLSAFTYEWVIFSKPVTGNVLFEEYRNDSSQSYWDLATICVFTEPGYYCLQLKLTNKINTSIIVTTNIFAHIQ